MAEKDDINERRRQRIRALKRAGLTKDLAEELDYSERADLEKRLAQHKEPEPFKHFKPPTCRKCGAVSTYGGKFDDPCPDCGEKNAYERPMAVPSHGLMPELGHEDEDSLTAKDPLTVKEAMTFWGKALSWRARWSFRLARWFFRWKRRWRRLFPEKPERESFEASRERVAGEEYEQRKQEFLKGKGDRHGVRDKDTDEQRPGGPASQ